MPCRPTWPRSPSGHSHHNRGHTGGDDKLAAGRWAAVACSVVRAALFAIAHQSLRASLQKCHVMCRLPTGPSAHPIARLPAIALVVTDRKDHHHSRHWRLVVWSKRPLYLVADRRQTFEIVGNRAGVGFRQSGERAPRHDRSEESPVWPNAGLDRLDNLIPAPTPQPRFVVRREVRTDECAQTRQVETDVEPARKRDKSGFPRK